LSRFDGRARAQAIADAGGVMTHKQILAVIAGLMAAMFLSSLNQTVVGTSMRTIADDLGGLSLQAWVTTAFLIVSTVTTPIYGKLSDIFGRRPLFIIAIVLFLIGSAMSAFSTSMYELAAFRAVQGLGAGGLMALPLATMGDILAPRERAKYQGYFLAVFGISSVIGPLVGGFFAGIDTLLFIDGWRWVFLINIPIGLVALGIVMAFLHLPKVSRSVRIDWWGAAFVILATVPLILIAEQGREWGWASVGAFACYVLTVVGLVGFVLVERRMGDDALIPLKLFRNSTFSVATVLGVLVGFGMFGAMMTMPLYLQLVNGATPTEAGLLMVPMILGLMIASIVSGQVIARTGRYKQFPIIGSFLLTAAFFFLTFSTYDKPVWFTMIGMFVTGLGLGQLMQTLTIASQNAVGPRDMGVATSGATFFRQIGGTLGVAAIFSVLFSRLGTTLTDSFQDPQLLAQLQQAAADPTVQADPDNARILQLLQDPSGIAAALNGDTSFLNTADPRLAAPFLQAFAEATVTVFWVTAAVAAVAFVVSWFLKATPLRSQSAMQEAHAQNPQLAAEQASEQMGALSRPGLATDSIPVVPDELADAEVDTAKR
jgi:EmrB/QacA subfamily drug resistance transporter